MYCVGRATHSALRELLADERDVRMHGPERRIWTACANSAKDRCVLFEPRQCEIVRIEGNVRRFVRVVGDVFTQQRDNATVEMVESAIRALEPHCD